MELRFSHLPDDTVHISGLGDAGVKGLEALSRVDAVLRHGWLFRIISSDTSFGVHRTTWQYIPEDGTLHSTSYFIYACELETVTLFSSRYDVITMRFHITYMRKQKDVDAEEVKD
jgi:hypothetical protein